MGLKWDSDLWATLKRPRREPHQDYWPAPWPLDLDPAMSLSYPAPVVYWPGIARTPGPDGQALRIIVRYRGPLPKSGLDVLEGSLEALRSGQMTPADLVHWAAGQRGVHVEMRLDQAREARDRDAGERT